MQETDLFPDKDEKSLMAAFAWWEKKRLLYNVLTGIAGLIPVLFFRFTPFGLFDVFGIVLWGLVANVFYSVGFLIEPVLKYYFKSDTDFSSRRPTIFWIGAIIAIIVTIFFGIYYYTLAYTQD